MLKINHLRDSIARKWIKKYWPKKHPHRNFTQEYQVCRTAYNCEAIQPSWISIKEKEGLLIVRDEQMKSRPDIQTISHSTGRVAIILSNIFYSSQHLKLLLKNHLFTNLSTFFPWLYVALFSEFFKCNDENKSHQKFVKFKQQAF